MRVLKYYFIIIIAFAYSCGESIKQKEMVGKYINTFETGVEHYIILNNDSTYLHYYKSPTLDLTNTGKWSINKDANGKINIAFIDWATYGYKNDFACEKCYWSVELRDNELIFSYDTPNEMNFKKAE